MAVTGEGGGPLSVTRTGPAAEWADASALEAAGIRLVDGRTPVVLILVDGRVPPTRGDVDLVEAVSGATGRCAVGLDLDLDGSAGGAGNAEGRALAGRGCFDEWRDAIHVDVAVGPLDAAMARTLVLLAEGPARPVTPTPGQRRRALLGAQLSADRAGRARAADKRWRERKAAVPHAIADALEAIPKGAHPAVAGDLDALVSDAATVVADELALAEPPDAPAAADPPRHGVVADLGVALLTLGTAFGAGRLLAGPLEWVGLPGWAAGLVTGLAAAALAASLAIGARRRRIARERAGWIAAHLGRVRRAWDRDLTSALRAGSRPPPDGWRARHLAAALRAETGG